MRRALMQRYLVIQVGILLWLKDSALDDTMLLCALRVEG